jgi:hypothetical protein
MHRKFFTLLLVIFSIVANAQQLLFINEAKNKVITVNVGSKLFLAYKGYNNQLEYYTNLVTNITDSTITLGVIPFNERKRLNNKVNRFKTIAIKDIVAFRKRSLSMEVTKSVLQVGVVVFSAIVLRRLYLKSNVGNGAAFLLSLGVGLGSNSAIKGIFRENAKFKLKEGWIVKYVRLQ